MSWIQKTGHKKYIPIPPWFEAAKQEGKSRKEILPLVKKHCQEALEYEAAQQGRQAPQTNPDQDWVEGMYDMYEQMYQMNSNG